MDTNESPIYNIKVSEVSRLLTRPNKTYVRITGQLEQYDQLSKIGNLCSNELDNEASKTQKQQTFQQPATTKRYEVKVNFSLLESFYINEYNNRYDLMQVMGYLKSSSSTATAVTSNKINCVEFQVIFYRIIKKVNLKTYYETLDMQRLYLRKNGYLKENEIFF